MASSVSGQDNLILHCDKIGLSCPLGISRYICVLQLENSVISAVGWILAKFKIYMFMETQWFKLVHKHVNRELNLVDIQQS